MFPVKGPTSSELPFRGSQWSFVPCCPCASKALAPRSVSPHDTWPTPLTFAVMFSAPFPPKCWGLSCSCHPGRAWRSPDHRGPSRLGSTLGPTAPGPCAVYTGRQPWACPQLHPRLCDQERSLCGQPDCLLAGVLVLSGTILARPSCPSLECSSEFYILGKLLEKVQSHLEVRLRKKASCHRQMDWWIPSCLWEVGPGAGGSGRTSFRKATVISVLTRRDCGNKERECGPQCWGPPTQAPHTPVACGEGGG